jgi:hypothetical protein
LEELVGCGIHVLIIINEMMIMKVPPTAVWVRKTLGFYFGWSSLSSWEHLCSQAMVSAINVQQLI